MSDYIGYCVGREVKSKAHAKRVTEGKSMHVDNVFRRDDEYGKNRRFKVIARQRAERSDSNAVSDG